MRSSSVRDIRQLFNLGLILKVVMSAFEILGGLLILIVPRTFIVRIFEFVTQGELAQDPNDDVALAIRDFAHNYAIHTHYLISLYLILRGVVKMVLATLILRGYWVAYPIFIAVLGVLSAYELYRGIYTGGMVLFIVAGYDFILMVLTWYFYRQHQKATTLHQDTAESVQSRPDNA